MSVSIDLDTGAPPDPARTLELAGTLAEIVRTLNHATRDHGALRYPSEADSLVRALSLAVSRLPQLLGQVGGWLAAERAEGRLTAESGEHAGNPGLAAASACLRLQDAATLASALGEALDGAASVTSTLGAVEPEEEADG